MLKIRKSTSFLKLLIPPYLFQLHGKHKKNLLPIQNTCTFVGKYLKVIFTKNSTLVFDIDIKQTLKEKICFLNIREQFFKGRGSDPRPLPSSGCALEKYLFDISYRSSCSRMFFKTGDLKNWSLFLIKLQCFPVNILKFLRAPFSQNASG